MKSISNKKYLIGAILVALICAVIAVLFAVNWSNSGAPPAQPASKQIEFKNDIASFQYPGVAKVSPLSKQDTADKFIFRATNQPNEQKQYLLTVRTEEGIAKAANLSRQEPLQMLIDNTKKSYPSRFPEFKLINVTEKEINGKKAADIIFTYKNSSELLKQHFVIIMKDSNTAIYVSGQGKETDFEELNNSTFQPLVESLKI